MVNGTFQVDDDESVPLSLRPTTDGVHCLMHKAVFEKSPIGIIVLDGEGELISANPAAHKILPCLLNKRTNLFQILGLGPDRVERLRTNEAIAVEKRISDVLPHSLDEDCGDTDRILNIHSVSMEGGRGFIVHIQDVSLSRQAEADLRSRSEELNLAIAGAGLSYWERDLKDTAYMGGIFLKDKVDNDPFYSRVHEDDLPKLLCEVDAHHRGLTEHYRCEYRLNVDGQWRWFLGMGVVFDDGQNPKMIGFNQDIEESKRMEHCLRTSVDEKIEMVREIHHRVNNNLQTLKAMIGLRLIEVEDRGAREELLALEARIMTMALAHGCVYGREDLEEIDAESHFRSMLSEIADLYCPDADLELDVCCGGNKLRLTEATGCSFIIGELLTAVLQGRQRDAQGIRASLNMWIEDDDKKLRFRCNRHMGGNDGGRSDLGLDLVHRLIKSQMGGTVIKGEDDFTDWTFTFPS